MAQQASAAAMPAPPGMSSGNVPTGYILHTGINPDVHNGPLTQMLAGNPNTFFVRRNENGQNLPPPTDPTGTTGGAVGWSIVISEIQPGKRYGAKVINHKVGDGLWDGSPGPFDMFQFSPDLPALYNKLWYRYYFSPIGPTAAELEEIAKTASAADDLVRRTASSALAQQASSALAQQASSALAQQASSALAQQASSALAQEASSALVQQKASSALAQQASSAMAQQASSALAKEASSALIQQKASSAMAQQASSAMAQQASSALVRQASSAMAQQASSALQQQASSALQQQASSALAQQASSALAKPASAARSPLEIAKDSFNKYDNSIGYSYDDMIIYTDNMVYKNISFDSIPGTR